MRRTGAGQPALLNNGVCVMDSDVDFIFDVKMRIICIISVANVIQEHSFRIFEVIL